MDRQLSLKPFLHSTKTCAVTFSHQLSIFLTSTWRMFTKPTDCHTALHPPPKELIKKHLRASILWESIPLHVAMGKKV